MQKAVLVGGEIVGGVSWSWISRRRVLNLVNRELTESRELLCLSTVLVR